MCEISQEKTLLACLCICMCRHRLSGLRVIAGSDDTRVNRRPPRDVRSRRKSCIPVGYKETPLTREKVVAKLSRAFN